MGLPKQRDLPESHDFSWADVGCVAYQRALVEMHLRDSCKANSGEFLFDLDRALAFWIKYQKRNNLNTRRSPRGD